MLILEDDIALTGPRQPTADEASAGLRPWPQVWPERWPGQGEGQGSANAGGAMGAVGAVGAVVARSGAEGAVGGGSGGGGFPSSSVGEGGSGSGARGIVVGSGTAGSPAFGHALVHALREAKVCNLSPATYHLRQCTFKKHSRATSHRHSVPKHSLLTTTTVRPLTGCRPVLAVVAVLVLLATQAAAARRPYRSWCGGPALGGAAVGRGCVSDAQAYDDHRGGAARVVATGAGAAGVVVSGVGGEFGLPGLTGAAAASSGAAPRGGRGPLPMLNGQAKQVPTLPLPVPPLIALEPLEPRAAALDALPPRRRGSSGGGRSSGGGSGASIGGAGARAGVSNSADKMLHAPPPGFGFDAMLLGDCVFLNWVSRRGGVTQEAEHL